MLNENNILWLSHTLKSFSIITNKLKLKKISKCLIAAPF